MGTEEIAGEGILTVTNLNNKQDTCVKGNQGCKGNLITAL